MSIAGITENVRFFINRIRERLWVKPLAIGVLSIAVALAAKMADGTGLGRIVPLISSDLLDSLLSIMASSMLVIATFAVGSMVAAYSSASTTASPRTFTLIIADDISQRALSTFIGAFIFSIVGLISFKSQFFGAAGRFVLFLFTVAVFGLVILTFVHWIDRIARLGRLENTIDKVEVATAEALRRRREAPALNGVPAAPGHIAGQPVFAPSVGYLQRIDAATLQSRAEDFGGRIKVAVLPGAFVAPDRVLAYITDAPHTQADLAFKQVADAFLIGRERMFDEDPRYGLVVLSQIADRALSPGVNDPGTAIDVIGILLRLFELWCSPPDVAHAPAVKYDRVEVPVLSARDMLDDAFTAIERDGCQAVEVALRLQKALSSLASLGDADMREAAVHHAQRAMALAENALALSEDIASVRAAAGFAMRDGASGEP